MAIRNAALAVERVIDLLNNSDILCDWLEGDHDLLPAVPVGCVFPGTTQRDLVGMPRRVEAVIQVFVMLYHGSVGSTKGQNQAENLAMSQATVDLLEKDGQLGDELVTHAMVTREEHGVAVKGNTKYFATRILLEIKTRFNIGLDYE